MKKRGIAVVLFVALASCVASQNIVNNNITEIYIETDYLIEIIEQDSTFYVPLETIGEVDETKAFVRLATSYQFGEIISGVKVGAWKHYKKRKGVYQIDYYPLPNQGFQSILRTEWYKDGELIKSASFLPEF